MNNKELTPEEYEEKQIKLYERKKMKELLTDTENYLMQWLKTCNIVILEKAMTSFKRYQELGGREKIEFLDRFWSFGHVSIKEANLFEIKEA